MPYGSQFAPQAGRADTSTWWDPQYRRYALSPGHARGQLPDDLRPSARPVGGLLGFGSRFLGMPLLDLPSGGIVNQISNAKQIGYERKTSAPQGGERTHGPVSSAPSGKAYTMPMTPERRASANPSNLSDEDGMLKVGWTDVDETRLEFANQFVLQNNGAEVYLSIGQLLPPAVIGDAAAMQQRIKKMQYAPVHCVSRLVLTADALRQLGSAIDTHLAKMDAPIDEEEVS